MIGPFNPEPWMAQAACIGHDPELWFGDDRGQRAGARSHATVTATEICAGCPVRLDCLDYAMRLERGPHTRHGVWGGLKADTRQRLGEVAS